MRSVKNIAVAVDLSNNDKTILQYAKNLAEKWSVEKVNLIHVIPGILSPRNSEISIYQFLGLEYDLKGKVKDRIQALAQTIFDDGVSVDVVEGKPYRRLMIKNVFKN